MSDTTTGLNCPRCGGIVPIPEGQVIVHCPYCDLNAVVRGERGLRRYQLPCQIDRRQAETTFHQFLSSSMAIARDAANQAQLTEAFVAYLPFWMAWGRAVGYALGQKRVGSRDHERYEAREVRIVEELTWNSAACDVGEFGVNSIPLATGTPLQPFQADTLHTSGMVFEPVGSPIQARQMAETSFENSVRAKSRLDRLSQLFIRITRLRMGLVYYPLWVMRYLYRGRSFQAVIDGSTGQILYGKAPGNTMYRAAALIGGMLAGAVLSVDVTSLLLYTILRGHNDSGNGLLFGVAIVLFAGLGLMASSYRKFRYGEHYEFRSGAKTDTFSSLREIAEQIDHPEDLFDQVLEGSSPWSRR